IPWEPSMNGPGRSGPWRGTFRRSGSSTRSTWPVRGRSRPPRSRHSSRSAGGHGRTRARRPVAALRSRSWDSFGSCCSPDTESGDSPATVGFRVLREAVVDRVELLPHLRDGGRNPFRRVAVWREPGEQVGDLSHLRLSHPQARELLRPQPYAGRLHGGRVPRQEVLVRDDVRLLQIRGDLRASAERGHVEGDRVALREAVLLREDLDPALVQRLGQRLRVPDDLGCVVASELEELRERDTEGRHRMEVMVRDDAREYRALEPFDELLVFRVGQQDAVLRPWEGLVGRPGEDIGALVQRALKLYSRD